MNGAPLARSRILLVGLAVLAGTGCASYTHKALGVREPLASGDLQAAETFLVEHQPGGDGLPYLMELGLVQRYSGQLDPSNLTFQQAEDLVEELWTKSVSKEVLAFATSDETIPYDGEMWERVLVNYYRALNYIDLGDFEGSLVECRKINHKLKVYAGAEANPPTYDGDAFSQYLTAMLYEAGGEISDAWVSLRLADEGYDRWTEVYGVSHPRSLKRDLVRVAEQQGLTAEADWYREKFGAEAEGVTTAELLERGEIVLFWEEGFVPAKIQVELTIPILKNEWGENWVQLAPVLTDRYYAPILYSKSQLEYLLRVALPTYLPPGPADGTGHALLSLAGATSRSEDRAPPGGDGTEPEDGMPRRGALPIVQTELASDIGAIARQGLVDRYPKILLRTIARALAKYAMTRAAENENEIAGLLANLFTAATEKADTRSWITLPNSIQVARLVVEPGTHDLELRCYGPAGDLRETVSFEAVTVGAGEVHFLAHRTY